MKAPTLLSLCLVHGDFHSGMRVLGGAGFLFPALGSLLAGRE